MILSKQSSLKNTEIIAKKYAEILSLGVNASQILVLCFNAVSKKHIIKNILNFTKNNIITDWRIHTFNGLVYNTILDNWPFIENNLKDTNSTIIPNLSGLELSQFLLKQIIKENDVKGYNSKKSLLHQIFRRYSLIVNNNLSDSEITERSKILGEAFADDASNIIHKYRSKTLLLRTFDYLRQCQIFEYIIKNTNYFKDIKYLLIDDADEMTPLMIDFIEKIAPQLKDSLIILDKNGGSRCGYLCADPNVSERLENIFHENINLIDIDNENTIKLFENIVEDKTHQIQNLETHSLSKRLEMLEYTIKTINSLLENGIKPSDISIITPIQDTMLKFTLSEGLENCNPVFLSGNEKLIDNPLVKAVITILKITLNKHVEEYDLRVILSKFCEIPIKNCKEIFENYRRFNSLNSINLGFYTEKYNVLCQLIEKVKVSNSALSEKAYFIYSNIIKQVDKNDLAKFNFFLKELQDFEKIKDESITDEEIITQLENSIISENPYNSVEINKTDLLIATPQKIIDNKIKTKYQIWLDTSSLEWIKSDIGPLYNAWVFQKSWNKNEYTIEDSIKLSKLKTAKILRKLILNTEKVIALSSLFDTQGVENIGGIDKYLIAENVKKQNSNKTTFNIIPRKDQEPVLNYKNGRMGISAVPGAGKTTILLALIIKLLENDINPENIYVLTYMESAARNFKDKIKNINPDSSKIPNISTIHGLGLRILKENSNFERLGLNSDFEICDDTQRGRIIKFLSKNLEKQDIEDFDRAISVVKLSGAELNPQKNAEIAKLLTLKKGNRDELRLSRFLRFFFNYQHLLSHANLIDYDDILSYSVRLLEENKDIFEYYQNVCEYIIEDEAQDSSAIQQKLITMLSNKHKNLIRCGDINQAITTTFTNADVEGFKAFIENSDRVDMNCSQRCSKGIWKLANSLVKYGILNLKNSFYEIYMNPVEGRNPNENKPIFSNIYKNNTEEKIETVKSIKSLLKKEPQCTIGILLRNNYQVNNWTKYINNSGLSTITRNECLGQKTIFKVIFSILKLIIDPYNNYTCAQAYRAMSECGFVKPHLDKIIEDSTEDFIAQDNDNIADADLSRFHWDMNYWLSYSELSIDELVLKIGLNYFSEDLAKSNIYLISTLCAKLSGNGFVQTVKHLEELSTRPSLSGFKFFSEEDEDKTNGKIQIMTMHKSKGDEFDYVFIPEMSEKNLTLRAEKLKIKQSSYFIEQVKGLNKSYKIKTDNELKDFILSENYRLMYVAITRAKKRLYISATEMENNFGRNIKSEPSIIFSEILNF